WLSGRATSTGLALTGLSGCDTLDTLTDGTLVCGADANTLGQNGAWQQIATNVLAPTNTSAGIIVNASSTFGTSLRIDGSVTSTGRFVIGTSQPSGEFDAGDLFVGGQATVTSAFAIAGLTGCTALETNGLGTLICGTDEVGGAGGDPGSWQSIATNVIAPTNTSAGIIVNASSTFGTSLRIDGNTTSTGRFVIGTTQPAGNVGAGDLFVGGDATTTGSLSLGAGSASDDDYLMFDSAGAEALWWDELPGQFQLTDDLVVNGNATTTGRLMVGSSVPPLIGNFPDSGLYVGDSATITGDLLVGGSGANNDDNIYFDYNHAEALTWDDSPGQFILSDDLETQGNSTTTGKLVIGTTQPTGVLGAGDLFVGGDATTTGNLAIGTSAANDDDYLFFDSTSFEALWWDDSPGQFQLTDDLLVNGIATVTTKFSVSPTNLPAVGDYAIFGQNDAGYGVYGRTTNSAIGVLGYNAGTWQAGVYADDSGLAAYALYADGPTIINAASTTIAGTLRVDGNATTTGKVVIGTTQPTGVFDAGDLFVGGQATVTSAFAISGLTGCTALETNGLGTVLCGSDDVSGATLAPGAWNAFSANVLTPTNTSAGIIVHASSTIQGGLRVDGNATTTGRMVIGTTQMSGDAGTGDLLIGGSASTTNFYISDRLKLTGGTATSPGLTWSGDEDTGFSQVQGVDTLTLSIGGAQELNMRGTGTTFQNNATVTSRLIVGSTEPTGDVGAGDLFVGGDATTTSLAITDYASCSTLATNAGGTVVCEPPQMNYFVDTTQNNISDSANNVEYWNGTEPNITPKNADNEVLVMVSVEFFINGTGDQEVSARVERNTAAGVTCGSHTRVGSVLSQFSSDTGVTSTGSLITVVAPVTISQVNFSVCSDLSGVGTTGAIGQIFFTLFEVNDAADLAEIYPTMDMTLEPGEVVALDPLLPNGVRRTGSPYDQTALGVVSTRPAMVIGGTGGIGVDGVPVALSGRVPVKVTTKNGEIKPGDFLTTSDEPGVAMKATRAGHILGVALDGYDGAETGTVTLFVRSGQFNGDAQAWFNEMQERPATAAEILAHFAATPVATSTASVIFTDRLLAGLEVVAPRVTTQELATDLIVPALGEDLTVLLGADGRFVVSGPTTTPDGVATSTPVITFDSLGNATFAGDVTARRVRADTIEGLEFITGQLSSLSENVAALNASTTAWVENFAVVQLQSQDTAVSGTLAVNGPATFASSTAFLAPVTLDNRVTVRGSLDVAGAATFGGDTQFTGPVQFTGSVLFADATGTSVLTFDAQGNATFGGRVAAAEVVADRIISPTIDALASTTEQLATTTAALQGKISDLETRVLDLVAVQQAGSELTVDEPVPLTEALRLDYGTDLGNVLTMLWDTVFFGRPYFTTDTAGFAVIPAGADRVEVTFAREYVEPPVVTVSMTFAEPTSTASTTPEQLAADERALLEQVFAENLQYLVTRKSVRGFTIVLSKSAPRELQFSWIALAVKGVKVFTPQPTAAAPSPEPTPTPSSLDTSVQPVETSTSTSEQPSDVPITQSEASGSVQNFATTTTSALSEEPTGEAVPPPSEPVMESLPPPPESMTAEPLPSPEPIPSEESLSLPAENGITEPSPSGEPVATEPVATP
ncbi:MAG: hypothetical protein G01um101431_805, partial [Parcubacteria group bacterium Gr01-1014_31]